MSIAYHPRVGLVEDIMTPRSLLRTVSQKNLRGASAIAKREQFDVIPISKDDKIVGFWNSLDRETHALTSDHLVAHDQPVGRILDRLVGQGVQFVSYRDQIVGLVDLSDLNKPLARVTMAQPLLAIEQLIVTEFRARRVSDRRLSAIIGDEKIAAAAERRASGRRENLDAPLAEFLYFGDILRVAAHIGLIPTKGRDINRLNHVRNQVLHPAHRLVAVRRDGDRLIWAIAECERILNALSSATGGEQD